MRNFSKQRAGKEKDCCFKVFPDLKVTVQKKKGKVFTQLRKTAAQKKSYSVLRWK